MGKILDLFTAFRKAELKERELHFDRWEPKEAEKPEFVEYFRQEYEDILNDCGDHEEAAEARQLYELVRDNPLSASKKDIQEHFAFVFECVGGEIEKYYDKCPEILRMINRTVCPDPKEE